MKKNIIIATLILTAVSCSTPVPKPYSYFRIDLPPHDYVYYDSLSLPFRFEKGTASDISFNARHESDNLWFDITYPSFNARVYCNYARIKGNLALLSEDSRSLAYKHTVRADAIIEETYDNPSQNVHAILYRITGNAASPLQFVATDSTRHFLRGSVYFNNTPNADSIAPVARFIEDEVTHLIETLQWRQHKP